MSTQQEPLPENRFQLFGHETERLRLVSILDKKDQLLPLWLEFCQDPTIYKFFCLDSAKISPERFAAGWFSIFIERRHRNHQGCYNAIFEKGTDTFLGFTGLILHDVEQPEDVPVGYDENAVKEDKQEKKDATPPTPPITKQYLEISYSLLPAARGKGYATEITQYLRDYAFTHPDVFYLDEKYNNTIISVIHPENLPSQKVAERNGMTLLKPFLFHGKVFNMFHITKDKWLEIEEEKKKKKE